MLKPAKTGNFIQHKAPTVNLTTKEDIIYPIHQIVTERKTKNFKPLPIVNHVRHQNTQVLNAKEQYKAIYFRIKDRTHDLIN